MAFPSGVKASEAGCACHKAMYGAQQVNPVFPVGSAHQRRQFNALHLRQLTIETLSLLKAVTTVQPDQATLHRMALSITARH